MTTAQPRELLVETGGWPDAELFVLSLLADGVHDDDGDALGDRVDTETGEPIPEHFIRVGEQPGRPGVDPSGVTGSATVLIEVYGPRRASAKRMTREVTELMLALDRGGSHLGVLVDNCFSDSADAPEDDRDEDDRRRSSLWTLQWRRHRGAAVYV